MIFFFLLYNGAKMICIHVETVLGILNLNSFLAQGYTVRSSLVMLGTGSELQLPVNPAITKVKTILQLSWTQTTLLLFTLSTVFNKLQEMVNTLLQNRLLKDFAQV